MENALIGTNGRRGALGIVLFAALIGAPAHADDAYAACYGCHGTDGVSNATHLPTIAGLNFRYFYATMQAFRRDRRQGTIMGRIAKGYKSSQLQRMALYFGSQPWAGRQGGADPELAQQGRVLHAELCEKCHKDNGWFQDKDTPPLAGQAPGYLFDQMRDYRIASGMMLQPPLMQERLERLSDDQLRALSAFYASTLASEPGTGPAK